MEEFGKITLRRAEGSSREGHGRIRVVDHQIEVVLEGETHRVLSARDLALLGKRGLTFSYEAEGEITCSFTARSASVARQLIEALALASERATVLGEGEFLFPGRTPVRQAARAMFFVVFALACLALLFAVHHEWFPAAFLAAIPLATISLGIWRKNRLGELDGTTRVTIDDADVTVRPQGAPATVIPLAAIEDVAVDGDTVRIRRNDGAAPVVIRRHGGRGSALERAIVRARGSKAPPPAREPQAAAPSTLDWTRFVTRLARGPRDVPTWRSALRDGGTNAAFRDGEIPTDVLFELLEARDAPLDLRVGACLTALGRSDAREAARIRVADLARRETSPGLRVALSAALEDDDAALERALGEESERRGRGVAD